MRDGIQQFRATQKQATCRAATLFFLPQIHADARG
jgi:hypothetical protein